jgi:tetratricopeptide (TPR) repeat protein
MFLKLSIKTALLALVCAAFALVSFAQTAPVSGVVKIKKADGTTVPAAGMTVDAYRTDIDKGKMPSAKTNKKGEFNFVGFILGQSYCLVVSGEGISPQLQPRVKAGMDTIAIEVNEGDGKTWTEEQVRAALKGSTTQGNGEGPKQLTAEQKKQQEDAEKKNAEITAKNTKIQESNKIINASFQEGDKLYKAKDYSAAITKFDEGIAADPEFEGSAPILLNYKAIALKDRGFESYKQSVGADDTTKTAAMEKAKNDFHEAITSLDKAIAILTKAPASADPNAQKTMEATKRNILANYVEIYRLTVKTRADASVAKNAGPVFEQYFTAESDAAKRLNARIVLGDIMQEAGESQAALDAYLAVLQESPDNVDALAGAGFSLVNVGYLNNDKTKFQDAVNYLQRFVATAPDTNKLKADAVAVIDTLKKEQNVAPQKGGSAPKKKGQ